MDTYNYVYLSASNIILGRAYEYIIETMNGCICVDVCYGRVHRGLIMLIYNNIMGVLWYVYISTGDDQNVFSPRIDNIIAYPYVII